MTHTFINLALSAAVAVTIWRLMETGPDAAGFRFWTAVALGSFAMSWLQSERDQRRGRT